jgi:hypothetical protein
MTWHMPPAISAIFSLLLKHMYRSILSFETINKLKLFFECGIPMPQDAGAPSLLLVQSCNLYIISIAICNLNCMNVPPTQGYRKETPFPH